MAFLNKIFNRITITGLLIAIQAVMLAVILFQFIFILPIVSLFGFILSILIILGLVVKDETSAYKIAWILTISLLPLLGGILYLLFGDKKPSRKMSKKINEATTEIENSFSKWKPEALDFSDKRITSLFHYLTNESYPVYKNTQTKYYSFGQFMFKDMLEEIKKAESFIFLEYFIIEESGMWDQIVEILIEKAGQGVDVRLTYDDIGSLKFFTPKYKKELESKKIKVVAFNPFIPVASAVMNNRNHRKILIIDGKVAFNGGINISDEYINEKERFGVWKDSGVRIEGEAVVGFTKMFLNIWNAFCLEGQKVTNFEKLVPNMSTTISDGFVVPYDDSPLDNETLAENVYIDVLNQATDYVYIFTPYLIISDKMIYALQMAAKRQVDVRIVTPGIPDKKLVYTTTQSYYEDLLLAGIRVYEYSPGFLHAKSFLSDDDVAIVGTINLDYRSLYLHFECATLLYQTESIKEIKKDYEETFAQCREVLLSGIQKNFWSRLRDAVLRLFAPMM